MTAKDSISVSLFVCEKGERTTRCKGGDSQEVEGGMVGEAGHNTRTEHMQQFTCETDRVTESFNTVDWYADKLSND